jgi:hypothetical protein
MATVTDPKNGVTAVVTTCRSCRAPVYWGYTAKGKRCPYDVVDGAATEISHFATCPQAKQWTKR